MRDSLVLSSADTFNDDHEFLIGFDLERAAANLSSNDDFIRKMSEKTKRTKTFAERYALLKSGKGKHLVTAFLTFLLTDFIKRIKTQVLLGCFSSDCCNPTMWAHYAGNGTGFVVGYDRQSIEKGFKNSGSYDVHNLICDVKYSNDAFDCTETILGLIDCTAENESFFVDDYMNKFFENLDDSAFEFFFTKSTQWSYEKEKRILVHNPSQRSAIHEEAIKLKPSAIIVGGKMSLANRYLIASICKVKGIPLYQAENSFSSKEFRLGIRPVLSFEVDELINEFHDFLSLDGLVN